MWFEEVREARANYERSRLLACIDRIVSANGGEDDQEACYNLGLAYEGLMEIAEIDGDFKALTESGRKVIELMQKVIDADPELIDAHRAQGMAYGLLIRDPFTAMKFAKAAIDKHGFVTGKDPDDFNVCVWCLIKDLKTPRSFGGNPQRAIERGLDLLKRDPDSDLVFSWLALAYKEVGDDEEALSAARKALEINPNNLRAKAFMEANANQKTAT